MAGVQVRIDDRELLAALERLARYGARPEAAMKDAGEYMQRVVDDRFNDGQGPDGQGWEPNSAVTLLRKKNPRILHEAPLLRGSIHYRAGSSEMRQGTNLAYAAAQQFGMVQGYAGQTRRGGPIPWGDIPARPFLGFSDEDTAEVLLILEEHARQSWESR